MPTTATPKLATDTPSLMTRPDAAMYLAVSARKLDHLVADGDLPRVKIGSCVRFERSDLDAFIIAQKSV